MGFKLTTPRLSCMHHSLSQTGPLPFFFFFLFANLDTGYRQGLKGQEEKRKKIQHSGLTLERKRKERDKKKVFSKQRLHTMSNCLLCCLQIFTMEGIWDKGCGYYSQQILLGQAYSVENKKENFLNGARTLIKDGTWTWDQLNAGKYHGFASSIHHKPRDVGHSFTVPFETAMNYGRPCPSTSHKKWGTPSIAVRAMHCTIPETTKWK